MTDYKVPTHPIDPSTFVWDIDRDLPVMFLTGIVPLPVDSFIELYDEQRGVHGSAIVKRVRLLNAVPGGKPAQVCLDCEVEQRWWDGVMPEGR